MRVLFVFPDHMYGRNKAIGVSLLAAIAKEHGHTVDIFDSSDYKQSQPKSDSHVEQLIFKAYKLPKAAEIALEDDLYEDFREKVSRFNPDIIAVSALYLHYNNGIKLIASLGKERKIPTIFGGVHPTLNPEEVVASEFVDMICLGEGEEALVELLEKMSKGEDITNIANIWVKRGGRIYRNPLRPHRQTLEDLPFVDWSLYPDSHFYKPFAGKVYRMGDLIASRGCFKNCSYCFYHAYYRAYKTPNHVIFKSPKRTIEELVHVRKRYNVDIVKMRDADFTAFTEENLKEMAGLYKAMGSDVPKTMANVDADTVTRKKARYLKEMNCLCVKMGFESGSELLRRKYLNRRQDNKEIIEATKYLRECGIQVYAGNMIGLPHETRENIFETIELNRRANVDIADVGVLFPFPGTAIYKYCRKKGFLDYDLSERDCDKGFRGEPVLEMPQISKEELKGLMRTFQLYMHFPKFLYPLIKRAERDDALGIRLLKMLKRISYHYIFNIKHPCRKLFGAISRRLRHCCMEG